MFETVIGLEVHAELLTKSKFFCCCINEFGGQPNTRCCPICTGMPGTLPVLNKEVIKLCIMAGIAMNCEISDTICMARKNYFYPDMPKAYQVTQFDVPLCKGGNVKLSNKKSIRINRIHIEEDAGKLIHDANPSLTLIDYNRCGVPLIEIVTEPDIRSAEEAFEFLEKVKTILKFTGVSDCKMHEGSLRCDVNVSIRKKGEQKLNQRVEYKNLNSFSAAERAIVFEEARQMQIYKDGKKVDSATMKWNDIEGKGTLMRTKEEAMDYRYFPEPDIPTIKIPKGYIENIKFNMPIMPYAIKEKYINIGLTDYEADILSHDTLMIELFDDAFSEGLSPKEIIRLLLGEFKAITNEFAECVKLPPKNFTSLLKMTAQGKINLFGEKKILKVMLKEGGDPKEISKALSLDKISDYKELLSIAKKAIKENPLAVNDYNNGKNAAVGFLVGCAMKISKGRADPGLIRNIITEILSNKKGEV